MTLRKTKKKRWRKGDPGIMEGRTYVLLLLAILALGYLTFLGGTATRSADDFWYSSFFKGTPADFFALTQQHYETFNGRAIIHIVAQLLLYFGNGSFALLMFLLMGAAPLLAEEGEHTWGQRLGMMLVFFLGMAVLPLEMTRQSLTWISAFCNYILPPVLILLQIKLLLRFAHGGGVALGLVCCLVSLLCGATTEQSGVVALCVALFSTFYAFFQKKIRALTCLACTLCALGGVATIFASPATQKRAEIETALRDTLGNKLLGGLGRQAGYFFSYTVLQIVVVLVMAALIFLFLREGRKKGAWAVGGALVLCLGAMLSAHLMPEWSPWAYLLCLVSLALCALVWWLEGGRGQVAILLCGLASLVVILPTQSNAPRTIFPFAFYLLVVLGQLAGEVISVKEKQWWLYPALFGMAACLVAPQVPHYWKNHQVETLNRTYLAAARESRVLYHCMDYEIEYSHTKAHTDGYTYGHFLDAEGFSTKEDQVYFYAAGLPKVYVNGRRVTSPALKGEGGNWLLPLRDIIEGLGGIVRTDYELVVEVGDYQCRMVPYGPEALQFRSRISTPEMTYAWHRGVAERAVGYYCTCVSEFFFTDYMGLEVEFRPDEEAGAFYVTMPEAETE